PRAARARHLGVLLGGAPRAVRRPRLAGDAHPVRRRRAAAGGASMIEALAALPLVAGMVVGFLGSPHCVAMCGGIAGALSVALPPARRCGPAAVAHHAAYSAGRIASYTLAGALAGALGVAFARLLGDSGLFALRTAAAVLLVA